MNTSVRDSQLYDDNPIQEGEWVRLTKQPHEQRESKHEWLVGRIGIVYNTNIPGRTLSSPDRIGVEFDPFYASHDDANWALCEVDEIEPAEPTPEEVIEWFIMWNSPDAKKESGPV